MNKAKPSPLLNSIMKKGGVAVGEGGNWDELIETAELPCANVILDTSELLATMATVIDEAGTGNAEYEVLMSGASRDVQEYSRRFETIRNQRNGRTGQTTSDEDYTLYMQIGIHFMELLTSMRTVLASTMMSLTEHYQAATEALKLRDVSEVSDVQVKEVN